MSHENQNEMLKIMAMNVLRKVASDLQMADFYAIMMDECTDISNKEQVIYVCNDNNNINPVMCRWLWFCGGWMRSFLFMRTL